MFEHVGYKNHRAFMEVIHRCLRDDGIALLHTEPLFGILAALIAFPGSRYTQLLLKIVRQKKVGALYEMGGKFFKRIEN